MTHTLTAEAPAMLTIDSQALGPIRVDPANAIVFTEPLAGFPEARRYAIVPHLRQDGRADETIRWLQSLERPYHAFVITDPWAVASDYAPEISDADAARLEVGSFADVRVFAILTVPRDGREVTINLRAPIVLNPARALAKQVVLLNDEYHTRHPLQGTR